ncbi:hypothetical protein [Mycobacterium sp. 1274756.6]|uniref:hypothetical protein n=1 Tax=Mycobacterium sp. 1274756.6 TaxID=1834076 RepID=UPI0007FFA2C2|nr:hypothetical protein [Mycobacterium sp. 1274756.6]OBJ70972.1 hypothetical protein A5643_08745 [Mycobacterium sp. 1274756.6]
MADASAAFLDSLFQKMMIDQEWSVRRPNGFTWWGYRLAQHVEVDPPVSHHGVETSTVRVWTDVVRDIDPSSDPTEVLGAFNMQQTMGAYVWNQDAGTISECCTAFVAEDNVGHIANLMTMAATLQNASAHTRAHTLAEICGGIPNTSGHPEHGERPTMDDLLNVPEQVIIPAGQQPSKFAGPAMENLLDFLTRNGIVGNTSQTALNCAVPFADPDTAAAMFAAALSGSDDGPPMSRIELLADVSHPGVGNGLLVLMWLPVSDERETIRRVANALNRSEAAGESLTPLLGAWCPAPTDKEGRRLAYCSFIPNLFARHGVIGDQILYLRNRSAYAAEWFAAHLAG